MAKTETVTILFTDMVGSTSLSSRLDPEAADKLRQDHFSMLRQALAASEGAEIKNLGDGVMAVFSSPSAAVACAVSMQQAVERENRRSENPVGLRVGLSGGEVTAEDDDYFGDPVVEAARLCGLCGGGQILTADAVRMMAGRRSPHGFTDLGKRELKGLPEPVPVCEVRWEPVAGSTGIPLPERLETSANPVFAFFGRRAEIENLNDAVKSTAEGTRRIAFLCGEPGIGKTSLCRAVSQAAHERGMAVLYGRCDEDFSAAYQPFVEALTYLVVHADESLLTDHVAENGGALLGLIPSLAKRIPDLHGTHSADPDSERLRLFSAVVSLLALGSSSTGLLLVLDDLHWADRASLQLLRHVASSTQLPRVMVIGTYRDSELSAGHPLSDTLASLRREAAMDRIDLVGLEDLEIIEMMEHVAGHTMDQNGLDLAHALRRETDGNPFFTTELLRHLGESGLVYRDEAGRWVPSEDLYKKGLPQSVREVVGQRVDRLGNETRRVLSQAAVIGRDFDIGVLAPVADMDEDELLDVIDESVRAGLLTEVEGMVDRFSFSHALTQHTLYDDLGASRRARIHRRIAEVLEQLYGDAPESRAAELARHFVGATKAVDVMKALTYSKKAGEDALAQSAPADAVGFFVQALDLYSHIVDPDEGMHCDLLVGLGAAQCRSGDPAYRQTLLDAAAIARTLDDTARLVAAALANSRGVSSAGHVDQERVEVLEDALGALATTDSPERAVLLATLSAELSYIDERERLAELSSAALGMARRLDDPMTLLRVTWLVYHGYVIPYNLEQRLDDLRDALAIASMNVDPAVALHLHNSRAIACLQAGDGEGFDRHVELCNVMAERLDQPFERWTALVLLCNQALVRGDAASAETHANEALAVGTDSVPEALTTFGVQLIEIRRLQGRLQELAGMCEVIAQTAVENPGLPVLQVVLARMYCDLGRKEEARTTKAEEIALGSSYFPFDYAWLPGLCVLSAVLVDLELLEGARAVYVRLLPWGDQVASVGVTTEGPVATVLGSLAALLGDFDSAEGHFLKALEICDRLGAPYWSLRTRLRLADTLERRGGPADAPTRAAVLNDAEADAARHGLMHLLDSTST